MFILFFYLKCGEIHWVLFCEKFSGKTADLDIMQMEATSYIQFSIANSHLNLSFLSANSKPNFYDLELEERGAYTLSVFIQCKLQFLSVGSAVWLSGWTVAVHTKPFLGWFL